MERLIQVVEDQEAAGEGEPPPPPPPGDVDSDGDGSESVNHLGGFLGDGPEQLATTPNLDRQLDANLDLMADTYQISREELNTRLLAKLLSRRGGSDGADGERPAPGVELKRYNPFTEAAACFQQVCGAPAPALFTKSASAFISYLMAFDSNLITILRQLPPPKQDALMQCGFGLGVLNLRDLSTPAGAPITAPIAATILMNFRVLLHALAAAAAGTAVVTRDYRLPAGADSLSTMITAVMELGNRTTALPGLAGSMPRVLTNMVDDVERTFVDFRSRTMKHAFEHFNTAGAPWLTPATLDFSSNVHSFRASVQFAIQAYELTYVAAPAPVPRPKRGAEKALAGAGATARARTSRGVAGAATAAKLSDAEVAACYADNICVRNLSGSCPLSSTTCKYRHVPKGTPKP